MESDLIPVQDTCPACEDYGPVVKRMSAAWLLSAHETYFNAKAPPNAFDTGYALRRCTRCGMEWADPMRQGSSAFYNWLAVQAGYYPATRWEWDVAIDYLVAQDRKLALLEVGCGSGVFLSKLKHLPQVNAMGLEPTNESLVACRAKGLTVCGDMIEAHVTKHPNSYDVVTAFHVLEHIEDPAGFLRHAVKLLRPNGVICIGTPLSPMSFETRWFDPLNHPPHHLTRWSVRSYQEIAQRLGLGVEITLPRASGVLQRTLYSIHLARRGRFAAFSRRMTLLQMAAHPLESVRELATQLTRKRYRGRVVADSVFVRFSAK